MYASILILLATHVAAPEPGADADRLGKVKEEISLAWDLRSQAVESGVVEWECIDDPFGRFESYWIPVSGSAGELPKGRLNLSSTSVQYHSFSSEYPELGNTKSKSLSEREYFRTHLLSHFQDPVSDQRTPLQYTITVNSDSVVHYWQDDKSEERLYPRAVILPAHAISSFSNLAQACAFASDSHDHDSSVPSPVVHQFSILPYLLSLRPGLFDPRLRNGLDEIEISLDEGDPDKPGLIALNLTANNANENSLAWRLFVDPAFGFSVCRAIGSSAENAVVQCDVSYDQIENGTWLPRQWTVQILGRDDPSYVRQMATFRRTRWDKSSKRKTSTAPDYRVDFADATWINNISSGMQSIVTADGKPWEIPESHQNWHSYGEVLALSQGKEVKPSSGMMRSFRLRRLLANLTQWPGLIIPLSVVGGGMFVAIRYFSHRREEHAANGEIQPSKDNIESGRAEEL